MNWLSIIGLCVLVVFGPATGLLIIAVSLYALLTAWANRVDRREGERLQSSAQRREEAKRLLESRQCDGSRYWEDKVARGRPYTIDDETVEALRDLPQPPDEDEDEDEDAEDLAEAREALASGEAPVPWIVSSTGGCPLLVSSSGTAAWACSSTTGPVRFEPDPDETQRWRADEAAGRTT